MRMLDLRSLVVALAAFSCSCVRAFPGTLTSECETGKLESCDKVDRMCSDGDDAACWFETGGLAEDPPRFPNRDVALKARAAASRRCAAHEMVFCHHLFETGVWFMEHDDPVGMDAVEEACRGKWSDACEYAGDAYHGQLKQWWGPSNPKIQAQFPRNDALAAGFYALGCTAPHGCYTFQETKTSEYTSCSEGRAPSCRSLGDLYETGSGVPLNPQYAAALHARADKLEEKDNESAERYDENVHAQAKAEHDAEQADSTARMQNLSAALNQAQQQFNEGMEQARQQRERENAVVAQLNRQQQDRMADAQQQQRAQAEAQAEQQKAQQAQADQARMEAAKQEQAQRNRQAKCERPPNRAEVAMLGSASAADHGVAFALKHVVFLCFDKAGNWTNTTQCQIALADFEKARDDRQRNSALHDNGPYVGDIQRGWLGQSFPPELPDDASNADALDTVVPRDASVGILNDVAYAIERDSQRHIDVENAWTHWLQWARGVADDCQAGKINPP